MRKVYILILLLVFSYGFSQVSDFAQIDKEIKNLTTSVDIQNYWLTIFADDQDNNGASVKSHNEAIDGINLYKVAVLIKQYGYPYTYSYPASAVPWLVWTHCNYPEVKEYTIPVILKAKELKQLPEGMYPDYFVGGVLSNCYGLDMGLDPDFNKGKIATMVLATKQFESIKHTVDVMKLRKMIQQQMEIHTMKVYKTLGTWTIRQFDSNNIFEIRMLENNNWYLSTQSNSNPEILRRLKTNKRLKIFEPEGNLVLFYFIINETGDLQLRNNKNETVKILKSKP